MNKNAVQGQIEETGIIAAVRVSSEEDAIFVAEALVRGGVPVVEIPLTVPQATRVIAHLVKRIPGIIVGAGGVRLLSSARKCLEAGAKFLTSDGLYPAVIEFAAQEEIVSIPGALTPTEVMAAWEAGSDFVKLVPCAHIGGHDYILSLNAMFPHIPLIAAGGVNQANASKFIIAGAAGLGIGRELMPADAIRHRKPDRIGELARRFLGFVKTGRDHLAARTARGAR